MRNSRKLIKVSKGFSILEISIVIVVMAVIMLAMMPRVQSMLNSGRIDAMYSHIEEFRRGMGECRARFNTFTNCTVANLNNEGLVADKLIDNMATANPWGGSYTITPAAQTWTLAVAGIITAEACERSETTINQYGGMTATCAGTTLTIVFNS
jgi:prepilin-type N-terminal cleavage/methylation domain-containing protein